MRRFLIVFATVAVCSAPTWADSITPPVYDLTAWATFNAPSTCVSNCTETIGISFLFNPPSAPAGVDGGTDPYLFVIGNAQISASGFAGNYAWANCTGCLGYEQSSITTLGYIIDMDWGNSGPVQAQIGMPSVGTNTLNFYMFPSNNDTLPYQSAVSEGSVVTEVSPVGVPDGDSAYLMATLSLASVGLVWRWRRREV
jgi:hypothetical protein